MRTAIRTLFPAMIVAAAAIFGTGNAQAMPIFAKAYGIQCSTCHTIVPALNAYGRYVQRTGYASLNRDVLKTVVPIWIGEQVNGDSTGGVSDNSPTHTYSFGNIAVHGAGYFAPDWTFHVQQWLLQNDSRGGILDTAWITYNNLFHRDGHLFLGKVEAPGPSPFSQWADLFSAFTAPEITVGEHAYQLDANRWGAKLGYVHGAFNVEAGWLASGNGLPTAADFAISPGTEKTFQWRVASAHADQPLELGAYGSTGSFVVSTGAIDRYSTYAGYVQRDPQSGGVPGVLGIYQIGNDSNPGIGANGQLPSARSSALSAEVFEPLFNRGALLGFRDEYTDDGLGTVLHRNVVDFAFNVPHAQYFHGYVEAGLGANSTAPNSVPTWRWELWWTTPIASP